MSEIRTLAELQGDRVQITIELVPAAAPEPILIRMDDGAFRLMRRSRDFNRDLVKKLEEKVSELQRRVSEYDRDRHTEQDRADRLGQRNGELEQEIKTLQTDHGWSSSWVRKEEVTRQIRDLERQLSKRFTAEEVESAKHGAVVDATIPLKRQIDEMTLAHAKEVSAYEADISRRVENADTMERQHQATLNGYLGQIENQSTTILGQTDTLKKIRNLVFNEELLKDQAVHEESGSALSMTTTLDEIQEMLKG